MGGEKKRRAYQIWLSFTLSLNYLPQEENLFKYLSQKEEVFDSRNDILYIQRNPLKVTHTDCLDFRRNYLKDLVHASFRTTRKRSKDYRAWPNL